MIVITKISNVCLQPFISKVFVIGEFSSDLHEVFIESLELVSENARGVLWHYLESFKIYSEIVLGDDIFGPQCIYNN